MYRFADSHMRLLEAGRRECLSKAIAAWMPESTPDQEALCQRGADVLLGEAGDQLADRQSVPSAQSMQQRHPMELRHTQAFSQDTNIVGMVQI